MQEINKPESSNIMLPILDGMEDVIYVSDPDTHELLYGNQTFVKWWSDYRKQKCSEKLVKNTIMD